MITNPTITVDAVNRLPHGTVRRSPEGFAHAILLDQNGQDLKWHVVDLWGPMETETDVDVADWPIVYVPAPDEVWTAMNTQPSYRDHVVEELGAYDGPLLGPDGEEVNAMSSSGSGNTETEQTEQQGRGDTHNGPTFPKR